MKINQMNITFYHPLCIPVRYGSVVGVCVCVAAMRIYGALPGWNTSYLSFVTTSDTKLESALAKNGTDATRDLQNDINFFLFWFVC